MAAILVVNINDQRLGLWVSDVVEVVWAVASTPLRGSPPIVEGVISLRGALIPLLNARVRFDHPTRPVALSDRFVVIGVAGRLFALHVDHAEEVIEIEESEISSLEAFGPEPMGIAGVVTLSTGLVLIQDMESFLSETERLLLDEALASLHASSRA